MFLPDPSELSSVEWQIADATRRLAQMVANAAVEDPTEIPQELLTAYHDSLQLNHQMKSMSEMATAIRMAEVRA